MPRGGKRKRDDEGQEEDTPRKLTKTEKRAAAIARAKAAMAEDKRKVEANLARKQGKPVPEPPKSAKKKTRSTPVKGKPKRSPRKNRTHQASTSEDEEMDDASVEEVKPPAAVKPQPESKPRGAASKMKSPSRYASRSNRTQYAPAVAASPTPQEEEEDSDDDMPPPPMPNLETQISQRVLANMAAMEENKPTPYTLPPAAAFENAPVAEVDEVEELEHDENPIVIDEEYPEETSKSIFTMRYLILIVLGALIAMVAMQEDSPGEAGGKKATSEPPCFKDNVIVDQDTGIVNSCTDTGGIECPDGGTCKWGTLVECIGKHYEISENKDNCVLTPQSKEKVAAIAAVLEDKTLQGGCYLALDEYPVFPYKDIQLANPLIIATDALEMSILENEFRVERSNGTTLIGLKSDYKLNTPMHCQATGALASILDHFGTFMIAAIQFLLSMVFSIVLELFRAYPMQSCGAIVFLFVLRRILQYRSYRRELANDVSEIRQIAYEYLEDSPEQSHLVLHVRDHIVMNIYPKEKRKYLIKDVWPRVVPDFKADHRIKKAVTLIGNQPRDSWQWVAAVSAKKKPRQIQ